MKGMRKIRRGKNFAGVVQYALKPGAHHKCDPVVIGGNMLGDTAHEMIAEFDSTKHLRQDVAKPVWHNSLRLPDGESLSNDQWARIADDYESPALTTELKGLECAITILINHAINMMII